MIAEFKPSRPTGRVTAPPSKSMAHRLLICGALARGRSVIRGVSNSDDVRATLACLRALGADYTQTGDTVEIDGFDPREARVCPPLNCNESGSTLRFLIPLCLLGGGERSFVGSRTLFARPLSVYEDICREGGIRFSREESGLALCGRLAPGEYRVPGNISSQFISGLLFALPLLDGDSTLTVLPPLESASYLDLTLAALAAFGIKIERTDERHFRIRGNQTYCPTEAAVEGDFSGAAFFEALSLFDCDVRVEGLSDESLQGDRAYRGFFPLLLRGTPTLPIANCPDLGPILMALAAAKNGAVLCGTRRLKIKESDRGAAMAKELAKFGCSVSVHDDSIVVYPLSFHAPTEDLDGHNDHRIVMALATLATFTGGRIRGAEAVRKSMPEYFDLMKSLGAEVELYAE